MKNFLLKFIKGFKHTIAYFGLYSLIIIPMIITMNVVLNVVRHTQSESITNRLMMTATSELNNINFYIESKLTSIHEDVHLIVNANEASKYFNTPTLATQNEYRDMLYRVMLSKDYMLRMQVIQTNGDISYRIDRLSDDSLMTSTADLGHVMNQDYFSIISELNDNDIYISRLHIFNQIPVLTLIRPNFVDNQIFSYTYIDINTQSLFGVLKQYVNVDANNITFGIVNNQSLWSYNDVIDRLEVSTNMNDIQNLQQAILNDSMTLALTFNFYDASNHFVPEESDDINFFAEIDQSSAIAASNFLLLKFSWLRIIINIVALSTISYIAVLVKRRNEDRLLINANMYLSKQNHDTVIITDNKHHIEYTNDMFIKIYGYEGKAIHHKTVNDLIGVPHVYPSGDENPKSGYNYFSWTKTDLDVYILNHLSVNLEYAWRENHRHYVYVYSKPRVELDRYHIYLTHKKENLIAYKSFLNTQPFIINKSTLLMIKIDETDIHVFAKYLKIHLDPSYVLAIIKSNYIMIYMHVEKKALLRVVENIDLMIERYRYLPFNSRYISYVFVIVQANNETNTLDLLLDAAMISLENSRSHPQYKHLFYQPKMKAQIERANIILNELENGFLNNEFYINYQPQKHIGNHTFFGVEALLRWQNKNLGTISPYEFIPVIENSFYISQLSSMVLKKVIEDFEPYVDQLPEHYKISVNLTSFDFNDDQVMDHLIDMIKTSLIASHHFIFEITESQYIDNIKRTNRIVAKLHQNHMMVAIDDFGTGYSSINSLKSIHVDLVKIDREFIKDFPDNDNGNMIRAMIDLIHGLNKIVIVEGTETASQIDFCSRHNCEYIQGYFISKPVRIETIIKHYLKNNESSSHT